MNATEAMQAFLGSTFIAALTWFFSARPRLFMRVFVPREELYGAGRRILRGEEFRRGMRLMALLQFGLACVFGLVGLWYRV
jgi:hypothetical protein